MEAETTRKKFLVVMSTGADEPRKAFTPFYYAAAAASMDFDTTMFFLAESPALINGDAYANWVVRLKPEKLAAELALLSPGVEAAEKYKPVIDDWGIDGTQE